MGRTSFSVSAAVQAPTPHDLLRLIQRMGFACLCVPSVMTFAEKSIEATGFEPAT